MSNEYDLSPPFVNVKTRRWTREAQSLSSVLRGNESKRTSEQVVIESLVMKDSQSDDNEPSSLKTQDSQSYQQEQEQEQEQGNNSFNNEKSNSLHEMDQLCKPRKKRTCTSKPIEHFEEKQSILRKRKVSDREIEDNHQNQNNFVTLKRVKTNNVNQSQGESRNDIEKIQPSQHVMSLVSLSGSNVVPSSPFSHIVDRELLMSLVRTMNDLTEEVVKMNKKVIDCNKTLSQLSIRLTK